MFCDNPFDNRNSANIFAAMKTISILVPQASTIQAIADPQNLFMAINQYLVQKGKKPMFKVQLVGAKKVVKLNHGTYSVRTDVQLSGVRKTDLILIPALYGDLPTAVDKNKTLIPWIIEQYKKGAEIASICVGAFLLAATGLLNGRKCSTHWARQDQLREMFPEVEVVDYSIITEEHRIYSSGGGNTYGIYFCIW